MPIVTIHGLTSKNFSPVTRVDLGAFREEVKAAVASVTGLNVMTKHVSVLMPRDIYGSTDLEDEVIIFVDLDEKIERTAEVLGEMSQKLVDVCRGVYPTAAFIECVPKPIDTLKVGYKSWRRPETIEPVSHASADFQH